MIEFEITYTVKYKPDPKDYGDDDGWSVDPEDALAIDIVNAERDPGNFLDGKITVTGKVIRS